MGPRAQSLVQVRASCRLVCHSAACVHAAYLAGPVGYIHEPIEKKMRVFELLSVNNISTRLVLESLVVDKVAELGTV